MSRAKNNVDARLRRMLSEARRPREGVDKIRTQIDTAHPNEATLPLTNQHLPQYHFIPAGTPTAHAVGRRGGVLGVEGTTHCAPHNSRFEHTRCKRARYR